MSESIGDRQKQAMGLFQKGRFSESTRVLVRLNEDHGVDSQRCFFIGRNFLEQGDVDQAKTWFMRSVEVRPNQWSYYQLARAEQRDGDSLAAGQWLVRFLECGEGDAKARGYTDAHGRSVLEIADAVFAKGAALGIDLYRKAAAIGVSDYRSALRIVVALIEAGFAGEALEAMKALRAEHALDGEGFLCLSRLHQLRGKSQWARDAVSKAVAREPDSPEVLMGAAGRWLELAAPDEAEEALDEVRLRAQDLDTLATTRLLELEFRLAEHRNDVARLAALFAEFEFSPRGELIEAEVLAVARKLQIHIENNFSGQLLEVDGLLRFYAAMRMEAEANNFLQKIKDLEVFSDPQIVMRRLELHCFLADLDGAEAVYEQYFAGRDLNHRESAAAIRFLAERKRWADAAAILKTALSSGFSPPGSMNHLLRVARRAATRRELLAILDQTIDKGGSKTRAKPVAFRQLLIDDLCTELGGSVLPGHSGPGSGHRLSDANRFLSSRERDVAAPLGGRTALYLCADKAYFFAVLTFLASYAMHNSGHSGTVKVIVFLSEDVPADWDHVLREFSSKIRQPIEVLRETVFDTSNRAEHGSWGFFSGGGGLSRAAYFRLYAARYLRNRGEFDRLCYIDSDIICQGNLDELFAYDFEGHLIAARCEEVRVEVGYAADRNSIAREAYFNSGVLLFDLTRKELASHLDRAIHLGENESHRLFFLDQCALNIAFENKVSRLPRDFNVFLRPDRSPVVEIGSGKLLHFVSSPKPWDISYDREYRGLWSRHAEVVRLLLNPGDYRRIVRAANGAEREDGPTRAACPDGVGAGESGGAEAGLETKEVPLANGRAE